MARSRDGFFDDEDGDVSTADATSSAGENFGNGLNGKMMLMHSSSLDGDERIADEGNIQEAESSLREGLSLNYEEARALLGRLEYQRGNVEAALRVFDGIDLQAAVLRLQSTISEKQSSRRTRSRSDPQQIVSSQHATSLVLEAIYLKSLSLQRLGKVTEAAQECRSILDAVERIFQNGIPETLGDNKLQDTVSKSVELLPELLKLSGCHQEAISSYRRALLSHWNLTAETCARIQKRFAIFLLYGGVEASSPSLASQIDGCFVPKNNLEEAILLLLILLKKWSLGKLEWDPSIMDHLAFSLSLCGQTSVLAKHLEEVPPGVYPRYERWKSLAFCYSACGDGVTALNLLRKSLSQHENPNDTVGLLLAAKICSNLSDLASEGVDYARRAVENSQQEGLNLKGVSLRSLGICLGKKAKNSSSDQEKSNLQLESVSCLEEASKLERRDPELLFNLALVYAEARNMGSALRCSKEYVDRTGGSTIKGWRLLALILSAQQRYSEAEVVTDAALEETAKWERGPLLRIKAKLKVAQSQPSDAIEIYRFLLALVQAQRKTFGSFRNNFQYEDETVCEFEAWLGLADLYASLCYWKDAEVCLDKAKLLQPYAASALHAEGRILESRGKTQEALGAYANGLSSSEEHVGCKVAAGSLLRKSSPESLPAARSFLSDALRLQPANCAAWFNLGLVHKDGHRLADAADCFQAAFALDDSDPLEPFSPPLSLSSSY